MLPLSSLKVLDLTRVRSGPTCVRQLADWGADCIKIEAPDEIDTGKGMGGARHGPDFQHVHRNKRGITLNLKHPDGLAAFRRLVAQADVVVENYRPDVKTRLGIDYEALSAINPRIILGSISGFGQDGPYAKRPGFDQIAQGMGGLMSVTGLPGQGPVRAGIPVADLTTGMFCAIGILIALYERERTGKGRWVHTSLLESMIAMMDFQATRWTMKGDVPQQVGNDHPTTVPTGLFHTADGVINLAAGGDEMWRRIVETLDIAEEAKAPELATEKARSANRAKVNATLQAKLLHDTSANWVERLNRAGVPTGPVYAMDQVFADEQVKHLQLAFPVQHPQLGSIDLVRSPIQMPGVTPPARPTPERGEHTDAVLAEFGFSADEIASLRAVKAL
ncbi:CaiB/BaiF CoA transferase family protein [Plastoroseomonas hellenica]|uniref:CoA transferase n=1 Tax=Plastoroseomonas hellenica TaxID=2687306 RepID=A0ABS5F2Z1_9PROT|nr:CaiB/BaiF CoA-transferase family protein [Plastoroseomonas hellenica]MBR0646035.1 CoA transferase [Plastoroseomonas hellenica]MBR0666881.1 CoA transferase [Plastoroseomonas hellenica]